MPPLHPHTSRTNHFTPVTRLHLIGVHPGGWGTSYRGRTYPQTTNKIKTFMFMTCVPDCHFEHQTVVHLVGGEIVKHKVRLPHWIATSLHNPRLLSFVFTIRQHNTERDNWDCHTHLPACSSTLPFNKGVAVSMAVHGRETGSLSDLHLHRPVVSLRGHWLCLQGYEYLTSATILLNRTLKLHNNSSI